MQPNSSKNTKSGKQKPKKEPIVKAPVNVSKQTKTSRPIITSAGETVTVKHREYIADISAANSSFTVTPVPINPGLSTSFPWLSQIATRYESYTFDRLDYVYQPICPTTTPGSIMMAVDFDAADPIPTNKVSLMAYHNATRTAPWASTRYSSTRLDQHKFALERYTRAATVTGDIKTYDVGTIIVASQNTPATTTVLGELYVEYVVRFRTPQLTSVNTNVGRRNAQSLALQLQPSGFSSANSIIVGEGFEPIAWYESTLDSLNSAVVMLNLAGVTNMLIRIRSTSPGPNERIKLFNNMQITDSTSVNSMVMLPFPWFEMTNNSSAVDITLLFRPRGGISNRNRGGLLPLIFYRGGSVQNYDITFVPIGTGMPFVSGTVLQTDPRNYDFPELEVPKLFPQSSMTVRDTPHNVFSLTDDPIVLEQVTKKK